MSESKAETNSKRRMNTRDELLIAMATGLEQLLMYQLPRHPIGDDFRRCYQMAGTAGTITSCRSALVEEINAHSDT